MDKGDSQSGTFIKWRVVLVLGLVLTVLVLWAGFVLCARLRLRRRRRRKNQIHVESGYDMNSNETDISLDGDEKTKRDGVGDNEEVALEKGGRVKGRADRFSGRIHPTQGTELDDESTGAQNMVGHNAIKIPPVAAASTSSTTTLTTPPPPTFSSFTTVQYPHIHLQTNTASTPILTPTSTLTLTQPSQAHPPTNIPPQSRNPPNRQVHGLYKPRKSLHMSYIQNREFYYAQYKKKRSGPHLNLRQVQQRHGASDLDPRERVMKEMIMNNLMRRV
jgi:hypothetical protein